MTEQMIDEMLNDIKFKGYACIEIEDKTFESNSDDIKTAIKQSYRYLHQYI